MDILIYPQNDVNSKIFINYYMLKEASQIYLKQFQIDQD
jgi:hypothetical protein